jgi:hypothetical protein
MNRIEKYILLIFFIISYGVINGQKIYQWNVQDSVVLRNVGPQDTIQFIGFEGKSGFIVISSVNKDTFNAFANELIPISFFKGLKFSAENDPKIVCRKTGNTLEFKLPGIAENQAVNEIQTLDQTGNQRKKTSIFHDAIVASDHIKKGNYCSSNEILGLYASPDELGQNNYLKNYKKTCPQVGSTESSEGSTSGGGFLSNIGGLDVTKYADGLAKFLVKRTKEELSVAFFKKFKESLNDTTYRDLNTLFPQTHSTLQLVGDNIYNYQQYINTLREQFEQDLRQLPDNLPGIIPNHQQYFNQFPEKEILLQQFSFFASHLESGTHPGMIINDLDWKSYQKVDSSFASSLASISLISEAFRDTVMNANHTEKYWVSGSDVRALLKDTLSLQIFMGFLVEEAKAEGIVFGTDSLHHLLNELKDDSSDKLDRITSFLRSISEDLDRMNTIITNYRQKDELKFDDVIQYFQYTINIFDNILELEDFLKLKIPYNKTLIKSYLQVIRSLCNLVADVNHKKYASAIMEVGILYEFTFNLKSNDSSMNTNNDTLSRTRDLIIKYGSFMSAMVQAETSEDVANVIETFALPSGSYSVKRESKKNIVLNSYVGLLWGWEFPDFDEMGNPDLVTLTAPVGVGYYWGDVGNTIKSIGIQMNVIDIGAITAFRFGNDSLDVPKIYLKEIISPGALVSLGLNDLPLSINIGWQLAPRLRRVNDIENVVNLNYQHRIGISLVVDIPLLNFYTEPKD